MVAYQYDSLGQLTNANSSVNAEDRGYVYDAAWNLSSRNANGSVSTFSVDSKNQLSGSYLYDGNGNLTNGATWPVYVYDDENRLVELAQTATADGNLRTDFVYDGLGRLRKRLESHFDSDLSSWVLNSETRYIYDGWRVIQERDGSNNPLVSYTRGNDLSGTMEGAGGIGGLLARSSGYSGGNFTTRNFYFSDGNGNVTYLIDNSQASVAAYRYDPFGNTISSSGTLAAANVYRFSSKEIHANSGMYYYGYRFYDPNLQRWINRDPIGELGSVNLYNLVFNNPVYRIDAWGLDVIGPIGGGPSICDMLQAAFDAAIEANSTNPSDEVVEWISALGYMLDAFGCNPPRPPRSPPGPWPPGVPVLEPIKDADRIQFPRKVTRPFTPIYQCH